MKQLVACVSADVRVHLLSLNLIFCTFQFHEVCEFRLNSPRTFYADVAFFYYVSNEAQLRHVIFVMGGDHRASNPPDIITR